MKLDTKLTLRQHFKTVRKNIPLAYQERATMQAAELFKESPLFKQNEHFACYISTKNEFNTAGLIEAIWEGKKKCYVPVLDENKKNELQFAPYHYGDALHLNRFSILEPKKREHVLPPEKLEVVILPLLAFDRMGHRLGTGGGYFDRTFAFFKENYVSKPFMLGLGYASQEAEAIPVDPWDIPLDAVLTEQTLFRFLVC